VFDVVVVVCVVGVCVCVCCVGWFRLLLAVAVGECV
jgi:hypothetical protein